MKPPWLHTAPNRLEILAGLWRVPARSNVVVVACCVLSSQLADPRSASCPAPRSNRYEPDRSMPLIRCRTALMYLASTNAQTMPGSKGRSEEHTSELQYLMRIT